MNYNYNDYKIAAAAEEGSQMEADTGEAPSVASEDSHNSPATGSGSPGTDVTENDDDDDDDGDGAEVDNVIGEDDGVDTGKQDKQAAHSTSVDAQSDR